MGWGTYIPIIGPIIDPPPGGTSVTTNPIPPGTGEAIGSIWSGFLGSPQNPGVLGNTLLGITGAGMILLGIFAMVGPSTVVEAAAPEAAPEVEVVKQQQKAAKAAKPKPKKKGK